MDSDTNQMDYYPYEVYFLGAGASAFAGAPTFGNFREKATKFLDKNYSDDKNSIIFRQILEYWDKYFKDYNIEEFYAAIEMNEILANNLNNTEKPRTVSTKDIEKFISSIIQKSLANNSMFNSDYEIFRSKLTYPNVVAITTNWDIVLESKDDYLESGRIDYEGVRAYGKPSNKRKPIKENDTSDTIIDGLTVETYDNNSHILKLHGSLNWGFCENCGQIYYFNKKMYDRLIEEEVICCEEICKEKNIKLKTVIVPPKLSKLIKPEQNNEFESLKSPYFQLALIWKKAHCYLKLCEKIYFIGYSFPETDVQMKIFISNALRENINLKKVIIVSNPKHGNSKVDFEERYLSILSRFISPSKINFCYISFEKFCNMSAEM